MSHSEYSFGFYTCQELVWFLHLLLYLNVMNILLKTKIRGVCKFVEFAENETDLFSFVEKGKIQLNIYNGVKVNKQM